jgi:hypothetical protein
MTANLVSGEPDPCAETVGLGEAEFTISNVMLSSSQWPGRATLDSLITISQ